MPVARPESEKNKILKQVLANPEMTTQKLAHKIGIGYRALEVLKGEFLAKGKLKKKIKPRPTIHEKDVLKKFKKEREELERKIAAQSKELAAFSIVSKRNPKIFDIPLPKNKKLQEATAIVQWSDWHVEEEVRPETVNGVNSYNLSIARERAEKLFQNTVKIVNIQRSGVTIKHIVIHLGGDFITGYIHPEGEQTNLLSPIDAVFYATDLIISGIEYILEHGQFEEITCVCSLGNHGRTTHKKQSNDYEMNYETFIYASVIKHFKNEKRVKIFVNKSPFSTISVYGKVLRFFHGDQVRFKGGVGGVTIPLYKLIYRLDSNSPAYYNFMGDKHTYMQGTSTCQLNGSMIGYNSYAEANQFKAEPPMQAFTLLDSQRGITIKAPIFCT